MGDLNEAGLACKVPLKLAERGVAICVTCRGLGVGFRWKDRASARGGPRKPFRGGCKATGPDLGVSDMVNMNSQYTGSINSESGLRG